MYSRRFSHSSRLHWKKVERRMSSSFSQARLQASSRRRMWESRSPGYSGVNPRLEAPFPGGSPGLEEEVGKMIRQADLFDSSIPLLPWFTAVLEIQAHLRQASCTSCVFHTKKRPKQTGRRRKREEQKRSNSESCYRWLDRWLLSEGNPQQNRMELPENTNPHDPKKRSWEVLGGRCLCNPE